jgi:hypothetical protein
MHVEELTDANLRGQLGFPKRHGELWELQEYVKRSFKVDHKNKSWLSKVHTKAKQQWTVMGIHGIPEYLGRVYE